MWLRAVLTHGAFAADSKFFEVGGSSLTAFAVVFRLRDEFGLDRSQLSDQTLYQYPTVKALAEYIDGVRAGEAPSAAVAAVTAGHAEARKRPRGARQVFMISSAGGTLGAYEKLTRSLEIANEIIGVRDPFLWGMRDPTLGFQKWVSEYVRAIRERQPQGPYYIIAYSSAGAIGYEIAQHLRRADEEVALLALIDPLAIDRGSKRRYGYWSLESRFNRRIIARITLVAGWLRLLAPDRFRETGQHERDYNVAPSEADFLKLAAVAKASPVHIRSISALLELNTGLPFTLTDSEMDLRRRRTGIWTRCWRRAKRAWAARDRPADDRRHSGAIPASGAITSCVSAAAVRWARDTVRSPQFVQWTSVRSVPAVRE